MRMFRSLLIALVLFPGVPAVVHGQIRRIRVPLGDAVHKALEKSALTGPQAMPFHVRLQVSEPAYPDSPYQGSIEEWWISANQWRRVVTSKQGMRQIVVVTDGKRTELDQGDYLPLWLREFEIAVFDPVPDAAAWTSAGMTIDQIILPNGQKSDACARLQSKIGTGINATDAFSNVCFDEQGRLKFVGSPRYSMEFHDYHGFGRKQIARTLVNDPEPGTRLIGKVTVLEPMSKVKNAADLITPLPTTDDRFRSISADSAGMERLTAGNPSISWPTVRSGKTSGTLAVYISADDRGNVREVWPLNSDNANLSDAVRDQVRKWKLRPATDEAGHLVQVEGGLGFAFQTSIADPLPVITGGDIAKVASGCGYDPTLPAGLLASGKTFVIRVSVDESGKIEEEQFPDGIPWNVIQRAGLRTRDCRFQPWIAHGRPTEYFIDFTFTAP